MVAEFEVSLGDVLQARARLAGYAQQTPLRKSAWLSEITGADVVLKLENTQVTGSFKFRGAVNALAWARENHISKIFTASAGNHALGIAEAAIHTERDVTICIPVTAAPIKKQKLKSYSVGLIEHGEDCEITEQYARRMAGEKKALYVSPYNNKEVIAGQGTVALEMLEVCPRLDTLIVACGGGGLVGGCALVARAVNPDIRIIGVVAANSPAMSQSIAAGRITKVSCDRTIADGIAGNIEPDSITFALCKALVDDWVAVEEPDIAGAVFEFLDNEGMLIEGAAAAAVAAITRKHVTCHPKERVGVVICGGNISRSEWREILVQHLLGARKNVV